MPIQCPLRFSILMSLHPPSGLSTVGGSRTLFNGKRIVDGEGLAPTSSSQIVSQTSLERYVIGALLIAKGLVTRQVGVNEKGSAGSVGLVASEASLWSRKDLHRGSATSDPLVHCSIGHNSKRPGLSMVKEQAGSDGCFGHSTK